MGVRQCDSTSYMLSAICQICSKHAQALRQDMCRRKQAHPSMRSAASTLLPDNKLITSPWKLEKRFLSLRSIGTARGIGACCGNPLHKAGFKFGQFGQTHAMLATSRPQLPLMYICRLVAANGAVFGSCRAGPCLLT